jgi:mannose-6-phosphate isomerase-like protein (cupin superfamily)
MPTTHRLPLRFDPVPLQRDLEGIRRHEWRPHFNVHVHDGGWSGVALRAVAGDPARLFPDPEAGAAYADTPLLARCPNVRSLLASLRCPYTSVRLLRLRAGSRIREHRDDDLSLESGEIRLHVPVRAHPDVHFLVAGERVEMQEGECWYVDLSLPHRVENRSPSDRIHLVVDCTVDAWLASLFPPGTAAAPDPREAFARFRSLVLADPSLQEFLDEELDPERFAARAVALGRARGLRFGAAEVHAALSAGRRAWIERWI